MRAFVINLDSAPERWAFIQRAFAPTDLRVQRVAGVDGADLRLPMAAFSEGRFRRLHGRVSNLWEIGCYLSHLKALQAFLKTPDTHGLICEDDVLPAADLAVVLQSALRHRNTWNILRLTGLSRGIPLSVRKLCGDYRLCVSLGRLKGAGAYVVDRAAAHSFVAHLLPMWLPYDHAFDREWFYGLRAAYVLPFPCSQTEHSFPSSIQHAAKGKRPALNRWLTTYPYQAFNEATRWACRGVNYLRALLQRPGREPASPGRTALGVKVSCTPGKGKC